jgi:Right handed beta helix region
MNKSIPTGVAILAVLAGLVLAVAAPSGGAGKHVCTAEISPGESVQQLVDSLDPGDVGCLEEGAYAEDVAFGAGDGGALGTYVTLRNEPNERATIRGRIEITDEADFVAIVGLDLDGFDPVSEASSLTINGDDASVSRNDIHNGDSRICINVGATGFGRAYRTTIARNKIHNCGDPIRDEHDHGVFVEQSSGAELADNRIYDNADRGVQLYPDAQGTKVHHNVIDGNGEGFSFGGGNEGEGDEASSDNELSDNVITAAVKRWLVEESWPNLIGTGNVASGNCLWPTNPDPFFNQNGGILPAAVGFVATDNTTLDSDPYVDRAGKDFTPRSGVCPGKGPRSAVGPGAEEPRCERKCKRGRVKSHRKGHGKSKGHGKKGKHAGRKTGR